MLRSASYAWRSHKKLAERSMPLRSLKGEAGRELKQK
jgi:hypothetical protein